MAKDYPISTQAGLTEDQKSSMNVPSQVYSDLVYTEATPKSGVVTQQTLISNNIRKAIVDYENAKAKASMKNSKALDACVKDFAESLAKVFVNALQAQAITVSTIVTTTAITGLIQVQGSPTAQANVVPIIIPGTGSATPAQVDVK